MAPLHEACRGAGDTERVRRLLDEGAPVDEKDKDGITALMKASQKGHTEVVRLLLGKGAAVDEKDKNGDTALMWASLFGNTEVVQLLLNKGAAVDEKDKDGRTALMDASMNGRTEVVKLLLDAVVKLRLEKGASLHDRDARGMTLLMHASRHGLTEVVHLLLGECAPVDEKDKNGNTALMKASQKGHTEVVQLLLGKGAAVDEKNESGITALIYASMEGPGEVHTEVVRLLLGKGAAIDEKDKRFGDTALMLASQKGHTEVVQLLLDKGAAIDEKDKFGSTALMKASRLGHTEVVQLLLDKGAAVDEKDKDGTFTALMVASASGHTEVVKLLLGMGATIDVWYKDGITTVVQALVTFDEDQLGRMAAAQVQGQLLKAKGQGWRDALAATATAVLQLVHLAGFARERALKLRSSDPHSADDHQALFGRLQLAAAACVQHDEHGEARKERVERYGEEKDAHKLLRRDDCRKALEHAVQIEAKELLAQPVVQGYMMVAWRGNLVNLGWAWVPALLVLLLQLLSVFPVALVPPLEGVLRDLLKDPFWWAKRNPRKLLGKLGYLLHLPAVKFFLECTADLALALVLTFIPASDLATAPVAPLLLVWVGSGLLWEARQVVTTSSSDATSRLVGVYERFAAYWADSINRVDATALIFSFAALVSFVSTDSEDATATSVHAAAVFLLWLRVIRVLLISPKFGPYVLMFFRMLFGDVLYFMVLLGFLLVAFAASWTVLLELQSTSSIAGCADELGGVDFGMTLLRLLEGALTGNDFFECARDSTNSPVAAWAISAVYVALTAVLLLNMLIAMMAKTFDNISEASATNYLFLFAQRTLALQNEPPTPPPLNALGLPCNGMYLLWECWAQKQKQTVEEEKKRAEAKAAEDAVLNAADAAEEDTEVDAARKAAEDALKTALSTAVEAAEAADDDVRKAAAAEGAAAVEEKAAASAEQQEDTGEIEAAVTKEATNDKAPSPQNNDPLAKKITEYILDNQDDAAQEERWRTTMKRETMKRFREQRAHVQEVETKIQALQLKMDEKMDQLLQLKMDEKMDQLIKLVKRQD